MTDGEAPRKKGGRPRLYPGTEKRPTLTFRVRDRMHEQLSQAAADGERSLSEEIERRLEASFTQGELIKIASDSASTAAITATMDLFRRLFGGEKYFNFGTIMASALQYGMQAEGIRDIPIHEIHKHPASQKWIEEYIAKCLVRAFEKEDKASYLTDDTKEGVRYNVASPDDRPWERRDDN